MSDLPVYAIKADNLTKIYNSNKGSKPALSNFNLQVKRGCIFGLLGPNGAGKSTFINILAGIVRKTSGNAFIWGYNIVKSSRLASSHIGIVPQEINMDVFFSPFETMEIQAGLYGVPKRERRTDEILKAVGLIDKKNAYVRHLSGGMKRRLLIAKALVHNPPVIVLDEPTAGVDIELREQLWSYIRKLNKEGVTIILTTHYLEEAEELCDEIAILNHGKLIKSASKKELLDEIDCKSLIVSLNQPVKQLPDALSRFEVSVHSQDCFTVHYQKKQINYRDLLALLVDSSLDIKDLKTKDAGLKEIFLLMTNRPDLETTNSIISK